jgi:hypothetical protein
MPTRQRSRLDNPMVQFLSLVLTGALKLARPAASAGGAFERRPSNEGTYAPPIVHR